MLAERTTATIHRNVSRGLFERHRLMFSFLLCCEMKGLEGEKITSVEWTMLLGMGGSTRGRVERYEVARSEATSWEFDSYCRNDSAFSFRHGSGIPVIATYF